MMQHMAKQIITVREILDSLNGKGKNEPWTEISGIGVLSSAKILGNLVIDDTQKLALKLFVHSKTGELKSFIAKLTDAPETLTLP